MVDPGGNAIAGSRNTRDSKLWELHITASCSRFYTLILFKHADNNFAISQLTTLRKNVDVTMVGLKDVL